MTPGPLRHEGSSAARPGSSALTGLTLSVAAIAVAITVLVAEASDGVALDDLLRRGARRRGRRLLVGTFFGRAGPLIPIGLLLTARAGRRLADAERRHGRRRSSTRTTAAAVDGQYKHGLGQIELDLTDVDDPEQLLGSTIRLENGAGEIKVTVPDDLNVAIDAQVDAGEIRAFDRKTSGTDASLVYPPDDAAQPALTLHIRQTFGGIEVIER